MSSSESSFSRSGQSAAVRQPWLTPLVGMALWLASVTAVTGVVSAVLWSLRASGPPTQAELDQWLWGSRDQKLAALREAYSGQRPVVTDPRRDEIEKFLTDATKSDDAIGEGTWIDVLDEDRFRQRVLASPWGRSLSWLDRRQLTALPISAVSVVTPNQMSRIQVLHIASPPAGGDETLVYTLAQQGYHESEPVLFWLRKADGRWKLVDWEWIDSGWTESESAAHWKAMSSDSLSSGYELAMWKIREADGLDYTKRDEFERCLREAENFTVPSAAADYTRYLIMNRWNSRSRPEEVRRLAKLVRDPDRLPGVHVLVASACQRLGETEEAFAALERLERLVGFRPSATASRAQMLQQARRKEDALAQWRRLADFDPGEQSYLSQMHRLLPKQQRSEILDRIKGHNEPLKLATEFVRFNQLDEPWLRELSQFAKSIAPDSNEAREIEIARLEHNEQFAEAAELSRQAAQKESDHDEQQQHWHSYLRQMHEAGEVLLGFATHPDPKAAFQALVSGLDDGEAILDVAELPPLLAAYRKQQADDPWLAYYEGYYAAEKRRFADADRSFASAERLLTASPPAIEEGDLDDVESLRELLREHRCHARYELGQAVETLEAYQHHEAAYLTLARLAVQYRQWNLLTRLNQSFATVQPRSLWLTYYEAKVLLSSRNFDAVHGKLRTLKVRQNEFPGIEYSLGELEMELLFAEVPDPVAAYRRSTDAAGAFQHLSQKLLAERDWSNLDKLCQQHRAGPNSPEVVFVRMEQTWRQRDHAGLVKQLTPWPTAAFAQRPFFESLWRERLVRCLLRLNRWDEAHQQAQETYQRDEDAWPLVMTYVAQRNASAIAKLLSEDESFAESWKSRDFATDPELRPVVQHDAFAEIRRQQLFALPNYRAGESLLLLLRKPVVLSETWLRERLARPETPVNIVRTSDSTFLVTWQGHRFQLMAIPSPYFSPEFVDREVPASERQPHRGDPLSVIVEQQAQWVIMPLRDDNDEPWNSPTVTARELGARLLTADVVGALYQHSRSALRLLVPLTENSADALGSRRPLTEVDPRSLILRANAYQVPLSPDEQTSLRKRIEARRTEGNPPQIFVNVLMVDDQFRMMEPFRVIDVRRRPYGGYELIGEFDGLTPNVRFPELRPGLKFVIPFEYVYQFDVKSP